MTVKIKLHQYYQEMAGGKEVVEAEGATIAELFDDLETRYPGIKEHLVDKRGKLQGFVEVFLNSEIVYPERTGDRVKDGDEVEILTIVAGG
jgi:sulfur-carrier protein